MTEVYRMLRVAPGTAFGSTAADRTTQDLGRVFAGARDGPHETTVVLTSPWPESVCAFAPMWVPLSEQSRLVAVDLPGSGQLAMTQRKPGAPRRAGQPAGMIMNPAKAGC